MKKESKNLQNSHTCDWCEHYAVFVAEVKKGRDLKPTGLNWYSCVKHKKQLEAVGDVVAL